MLMILQMIRLSATSRPILAATLSYRPQNRFAGFSKI